MRYRPLGDTGVRVSELSLGAMTFDARRGPIAKVDAALADRMVGTALERGVNLLDTADVYGGGESERILGRALGARRHEVLIATKVGFPAGGDPGDRGLSRGRVTRCAEESLERLGTDWIDLLQIHKHDRETPIEETARALDDLVRRGLVRYVGFSNLLSWEAARAVTLQRERGLTPFVSAQMYYSLLGRDIEPDFVPMLEQLRLALLVYSPLAGGYLTGKYAAGARDDAGAERRRDRFEYPPVDPLRGAPLLERLREVAEAHGATPAQIALAWLLSRPFVTSIIVGATSMDQLTRNLDSAAIELEPAELRRLEAPGEPHRPYPPAFYDTFPHG